MTGRAYGAHESSRPQSEVWLTPPALLGVVGQADLDPCAAPEPRPWPTADVHYVEADDGLSLPWFGKVWLNPPYTHGVIGQWMDRLADHGCGLALVAARTDSDVFHRAVWDRAHALFFFRGRLRFHYPDGRPARDRFGAPSVLVAYGQDRAELLGDLDLSGCFEAAGFPGRFDPQRLPRIVAAAVLKVTWSDLVRALVEREGGSVRLDRLYQAVQRHPKARRNPHWQAKVRQQLQRGPFQRVGKGAWALREAAA